MSKGLLGTQRLPVLLVLSPTLDVLEVRDMSSLSSSTSTSTKKSKEKSHTHTQPLLKSLPLDDLGGVSEEGKLSLLLLTSSGGRHKFETCGPGPRQLWITSIREGMYVCMYVCVCVCEREREMKKQIKESEKTYTLVLTPIHIHTHTHTHRCQNLAEHAVLQDKNRRRKGTTSTARTYGLHRKNGERSNAGKEEGEGRSKE